MATLKGGYGPPLGGIGIKAEATFGVLAGYLSLGYMPAFSPNEKISVPGSVNPVVGLQYRFLFKDKPFSTRFGAQVGWVANYYTNSIGTQEYNPHVYGFSFGSGAELYIGSFTIEAEIYGTTRKFIFNASEHPGFDVVWSPSIAIGFELTGARVDISKKWSKWYNKSLNSDWFYWEVKDGNGFRSDDDKRLDGGVCGNEWFFQQVDTTLVIVVRINTDSIPIGTQVIKEGIAIADNPNVDAYLLETAVNKETCCNMDSLITSLPLESVYTLTQGTIAVVANKETIDSEYRKGYKASLTLMDAVFVNNKGDEIYFSRASMIDLRSNRCD